MTTPTDIAGLASVPAVWPLGHGCVLTSFAMTDGVPLYFFRAVPDDHVGEPGDAGTLDLWDSLTGAPTLTLAFADLAAVERHIASMSELADAVRTFLTNPGEPHEG